MISFDLFARACRVSYCMALNTIYPVSNNASRLQKKPNMLYVPWKHVHEVFNKMENKLSIEIKILRNPEVIRGI